MRNEKYDFIYTALKKKGMSKQAADLLIELVRQIETVSNPLNTKPSKLALQLDKTKRTVQRYFKEIFEDYNYLHRKPVYDQNYTDPNRKPLLHYEITTTYHMQDLIKKAEAYCDRDTNVNFTHKKGLAR